ncbi:MAG TPA: helix-turn-helix transcriptional regulator [Streptosporangiaceae bacterium]
MTVPEQSPTVRHRRLAGELRRLRERAGMTPEQAAAALGWSRPKLVRVETAKTRPKPADVAAALDLYGGPDELKLALMEAARNVRRRGWWSAYDDVLAGSYAELEDDAAEIRSWQVQVIHGLLQTQEYARTLIRNHSADEQEVDRRVQARMMRQTLLARQNAPALQVLIEEAVLRRPVGGVEVMRGQLDALLRAHLRPNVSIRVVPMSVGIYPSLGEGSFTIFSFPRPIDPDVVYLESVAGGVYLEDVEQVRRCGATFDNIADVALSDEESAALIAAIAEE